jgi:hypothetical protein
MTSFTIVGGFQGRIIEITWIDGVLSGDPELVRLIELRATTPEAPVIASGSGEPSASTYPLSDPYAASDVIQSLLQEPEIVSGALPPIPEPPEE